MILIAMGANLDHPVHGAPVNSLAAAVAVLNVLDIQVVSQSSWYKTAPVPISDQPWFVNAVIAVQTEMLAPDLLQALHKIEAQFGRVREAKWEARVLDLDLIAYNGLVTDNRDQGAGGVVPHPHMQDRAFVLAPLNEIAPDWQHPLTGQTAAQMMAGLEAAPAFEIVQI